MGRCCERVGAGWLGWIGRAEIFVKFQRQPEKIEPFGVAPDGFFCGGDGFSGCLNAGSPVGWKLVCLRWLMDSIPANNHLSCYFPFQAAYGLLNRQPENAK